MRQARIREHAARVLDDHDAFGHVVHDEPVMLLRCGQCGLRVLQLRELVAQLGGHFRRVQVVFRERAVEHYEVAIAIEPDYRFAHYNLGALLYNRYTEDTNATAIEHFKSSAEASDPELRALYLPNQLTCMSVVYTDVKKEEGGGGQVADHGWLRGFKTGTMAEAPDALCDARHIRDMIRPWRPRPNLR